MRILVAIAHHGSKNRRYFLHMLDSFRSMDHEVDVVALCEEAKDLPGDVEQLVGLPSKNPWSLPFAHRKLFADRRDAYDLFLYSEDDTLIEQRHLDTFVALNAQLPEHLIPGFMRFEVAPGGNRSYCTVHSFYRWDPASTFRSGNLAFARFTNDHSACYALTRPQLDRALASGGFLVQPHQGRYDMLVSAATDVYTNCGFKKVLCVDRIEDQLVHHMPNVYLGRMGVDEATFRVQLDELRRLAGTTSLPDQLLIPETRLESRFWDRHSFPRVTHVLPKFLPSQPVRILSVGTSSGELEERLVELGHDVAAIPTDPLFSSVLEKRGIDHLDSRMPTEDSLREAGTFDLVLAFDLLPYIADPVALLARLRMSLGRSGELIATVPDHRRYAARNLVPGAERVTLPRAFGADGMHRTDGTVLRGWLRASGFEIDEFRHRSTTRSEPIGTGGLPARIRGNTLLVRARPAGLTA